MRSVREQTYPNIDYSYLLSSNVVEKDELSITFKKIDSTTYEAYVKSTSPFFVVLSESYDENWIAKINGEPIPGEYHFIANGYANAWYINKTGSYTITLEFWLQKLFYIGSAISITTFILCVLYISKNRIRTIYKRYTKKQRNS